MVRSRTACKYLYSHSTYTILISLSLTEIN